MNTVNSITNFYQYSDHLAAGGQPTAEQLTLLKDAGYDIIFNISPASAKNALPDEYRIVESLKMDYIHFPVDCSNLRELHYHTTASILRSLQSKKIFMHCGGNIKTSNLIHMFQVLDKKQDERESLKTLLRIQQPEEKWFVYFKKMGMEGIRA